VPWRGGFGQVKQKHWAEKGKGGGTLERYAYEKLNLEKVEKKNI